MTEARELMKTIIHVNQAVIQSNRKNGTRKPPITVKTYKSNTYADEVEILGPSKLVHSPHKPLPCGARLWIETHAEVVCKVLDTAAPEHDHQAVMQFFTNHIHRQGGGGKTICSCGGRWPCPPRRLET